MNLYLDDDGAKRALRVRAMKVGHHVVVPTDTRLQGAADPRHLRFAVESGMVLVTRNHDDFLELHQLIQATGGKHSGILAIRFDNDPSRDMTDGEIIRALRRLEQSGATVVNEFHILNHWR